jgi:GxxExxY protein
MGLQFEDLSAQVIGSALAVHKELGPGFLESTYHAAMRVSLAHRVLPFESQLPFDISFESVVVGRARVDLIVEGKIVVELKAVDRLRDVHFAQLKSYLRATRLRVGLLFNFNAPTLTIKRMVLD